MARFYRMKGWRWVGWVLTVTLVSGDEGAIAQSLIVPDNTLGNEQSQVIPNFQGLPIEVITGGAIRGQNLFHSFLGFNVRQGRGAYFFSPSSAIQNILARVTGTNPSQILGTIGTFGNSQPNLFLINPRGIIFGQGAFLDIRGSFVATTASGVKFGPLGEFSATNPQLPSALLTINPSAFFVNQIRPGAITVDRSFLAVPAGQSLLLLGGDITLNNGATVNVLPPGEGRVELGSLVGSGQVDLAMQSNAWQLVFPAGAERGDVSIANRSQLNVLGNTGGSLAINARNLDVSGTSSIQAGIANEQGTIDSQAGDIVLNATGSIQLRQTSFIANGIGSGAVGKSGNVIVSAETLIISEGSELGSSTFGRGDAGDVKVTANVISLDGTKPAEKSSSIISSTVSSTGIGKGGNVTVQAGSLSLTNGAVISASTVGQGDAGNVQVIANAILLDGTSPDGEASSGIASIISFPGTGKGGNVTIQTGNLSVNNGAVISASTGGQGDAGNVQVIANTILLDSTKPDGEVGSQIGSTVLSKGTGKGGNVTVQTETLSVTNGANINAGTGGQGDAGNVQVTADTITLDGTSPDGKFSSGLSSIVSSTGKGKGGNVTVQTGSLSITNGANINAGTGGQGDAGNVQVAANTITLDGISSDGESPTGIASTASSTGVGKGGNITVQTGSLSITNGAVINAGTYGQGDAGNVQVTADTITLDGTSLDGESASGITSQFLSAGTGKGGNVTVQTGSLSITNGAVISASTFGQGDAGNVQVTADTITLDGTSPDGKFSSGLSSIVSSTGKGKGGNVTVQAGSLSIINGARVSASASGSGSAGNLAISAHTIGLGHGGITAAAASGDGANITINVDDVLLMRWGSAISATAGIANSRGNGGNITINAPRGFLITAPNENNDITANAFTGKGGNIRINAQGIYWFTPLTRSELRDRLDKINPSLPLDPAFLSTNDITASSNLGVSGAVAINVLNVDPIPGLVELPARLVDASRQITQRCSRSSRRLENSFYITGNSGLPERPGDLPIPPFPTGDMQTIADNQTASNPEATPSSSPSPSSPPLLVEAQGFMQDTSGNVFLVANSSNVMLSLPMPSPVFCP